MFSSADAAFTDGRVIIHLDLDAFYAQVESRRLGIDPNTPLVVQQWRGIIAVNYAARAAGIKRHLTVDEATKLCPELVCVHVETIGDDEDEADDEDDGRVANETDPRDPARDSALRLAANASVGNVHHADAGPERSRAPPADPPDRERRKVSLARYRRASFAVMETLADAFPDGAVERASIDEAYVDVTNEVSAILASRSSRDAVGGARDGSDDVAARVAAGLEASGAVRPLRPDASVSDERLALGADACRRGRAAVFAQTGFTMSGGIAHNKMLAKLASARNKPNKQTVVSRVAVGEMLEGLPMRSIKGLGGKLGERIERALIERFSSLEDARVGVDSSGSRVAAERAARSGHGRGSSYEGGFTAASLRFLFDAPKTSSAPWRVHVDDKTASWLERTSRGEDTDPVVANVRDGAKSVTAFKSFKAVHDKDKAHRWLKVLAHELADRLAEDRRRLRRAPRSARLEYRAEPNPNANPPRVAFETRSKKFAFPVAATAALASGNTHRAGEALTKAAAHVFDALGPEATTPCTRVGLAASDFAPTPVAGVGIERFFEEEKRPAVSNPAPEADDDVPDVSDFRRRPEREDAAAADDDGDGEDADTVDASVRAILAGSSEPRFGADARERATAPRAARRARSVPVSAEVSGPSSDRLAALVACPRCGARLAPGREAQSHADEHLAFDLSKSEPQHRAGANVGSGVGSKRRAARTGARRGGSKRAGVSGDAAGTASVRAFFAKR